MNHGTFEALLVFVDAHQAYASPSAMDQILPREIEDMTEAASASVDGFLFAARRNWQVELITRGVQLPQSLGHLFRLPEGMAVDRLLGVHDDRGGWRAGIASLEPREAECIRLRVCERRATWEICRALGIRPASVHKAISEGRKKLRLRFGLDQGKVSAVPVLGLPAV
jgi:DNA-binding CsgD family transcriptional regulator